MKQKILLIMCWINELLGSKQRFLFLLLVICLLAVIPSIYRLSKGDQNQGVRVYLVSDLDGDGQKEDLLFYSPPEDLSDGITNIYINGRKYPELTLRGYYINSKAIDIKKRLPVIEIEVMVGKSVNSLIYRYQKGELVRIPVSTEKAPYFRGIVARNTPEFKDLDGDGVLEMLVYYRYFPPEKRRKVEVYEFNGVSFEKQTDYEELTPDFYL